MFFHQEVICTLKDENGNLKYPNFLGFYFGQSKDGQEVFISVSNPGGYPGVSKLQQKGFPVGEIGAKDGERKGKAGKGV